MINFVLRLIKRKYDFLHSNKKINGQLASKLKESMKIFLKISESMPMNLLNQYRNMNNDIEMIDSHEDAITKNVLEPDDYDF